MYQTPSASESAASQSGRVRQHPGRPRAVLRLHLWLENDQGVLFGMGRLLLLREIHTSGSLSAAAANLGMSYRGAWGKIKKTEALLGKKLIERKGCRRSGYRLTEYGRSLALEYERWFASVEQFALEQARQTVPLEVRQFGGPAADEAEDAPQHANNNILK
jgi:molybdate transport system regulatory protein